jgi:hypothetical protein
MYYNGAERMNLFSKNKEFWLVVLILVLIIGVYQQTSIGTCSESLAIMGLYLFGVLVGYYFLER